MKLLPRNLAAVLTTAALCSLSLSFGGRAAAQPSLPKPAASSPAAPAASSPAPAASSPAPAASSPAPAASSPAPAAPSPPDDATAAKDAAADAEALALKPKAAEHFKSGRALLKKGAVAAALAEFLQSRKLYPTWSATSSAAVALQQLERFDESLDMLETLIGQFGATMPPEAKTAAQNQVVELRKATGAITIVGAEIGASLMIDGRSRGEYPSPGPLNVLPGAHTVRIYKDGFVPFEATVDIAPGRTASLNGRMQALVRSGRLAVAERSGKALSVVVDGFEVGVTPWEGAISVGEHSVMLRGQGGEESFGTLPSRVSIQQNKKAELSLAAEDLAASIRVVPVPAGASVAVDGFFVGRGLFEGRVRPGEHPVKVVADGYFVETVPVKVASGEAKVVTVKLKRDPSSPLWAAPGHFTVELSAGVPISHSFGGTIAGSCEGACSQGAAIGGRVAFYGGYELGNGFGFGVTAGYVGMQQTTTGRPAEIQAFGIVQKNSGVADDTVAIKSFMAGAYGAFRLGQRFPVRLRLGAGVGFGSITDVRTGQFRVSDPTITLPYAVGPVIESPSVTWMFVEPDVRVGMRLIDRLEVSVGVSMLLLITPEAPAWNEAHAINASSDGYGQFGADTISGFVVYAATPGVSVRYEF